MQFSYEFNIFGDKTTVTITIEDTVIAAAEQQGFDLAAVEAEARLALAALVQRFAATTFWQRVQNEVKNVVTDIEHILTPAAAAPIPPSAVTVKDDAPTPPSEPQPPL